MIPTFVHSFKTCWLRDLFVCWPFTLYLYIQLLRLFTVFFFFFFFFFLEIIITHHLKNENKWNYRLIYCVPANYINTIFHTFPLIWPTFMRMVFAGKIITSSGKLLGWVKNIYQLLKAIFWWTAFSILFNLT